MFPSGGGVTGLKKMRGGGKRQKSLLRPPPLFPIQPINILEFQILFAASFGALFRSIVLDVEEIHKAIFTLTFEKVWTFSRFFLSRFYCQSSSLQFFGAERIHSCRLTVR